MSLRIRKVQQSTDGLGSQDHIYGILQTHMKTTLEIPDDQFIAAKKRAADQRRSLRDLVTSGLRAELRRRRRAPAPRASDGSRSRASYQPGSISRIETRCTTRVRRRT